MDKMTNEELVRKLSSLSTVSGKNDTDDWDDEIFAIQNEILSRLARVRELEDTRKEMAMWKNRYEQLINMLPYNQK